MRRSGTFPVLVAVDESPSARAVIAATLAFPWPPAARVYAILATRTRAMVGTRRYVRAAFDRALRRACLRAQRALARRWPDARVDLRDRLPVDAILSEAQRLHARAIVCGWRGRGALRRLLTGGSVSREVIRRARSPVLVVKRHPREFRRLAIGLDGSRHAERAVAFVAGLTPPRGAQATLIRVMEPVHVHSLALLPRAIRATVGRAVAAERAVQLARARRDVEQAAKALTRAGWRVRTMVREGIPLPEVLRAARAARAQVLVVGARGAGGLRRLLLGSVAEGVLEHADASVLVVR
jgi:nucleotide-binding universal stress UspA family protein